MNTDEAYVQGFMQAIEMIRGNEASDLLIHHQRVETGGCLCGWDRLGHSYSVHVLHELAKWLIENRTNNASIS